MAKNGKKPKLLKLKATHVLTVLKDNFVISFSDRRDKNSLLSGEYEAVIIDNPCNPSMKVLKLLSEKTYQYVNLLYLQKLDPQLFRLEEKKRD